MSHRNTGGKPDGTSKKQHQSQNSRKPRRSFRCRTWSASAGSLALTLHFRAAKWHCLAPRHRTGLGLTVRSSYRPPTDTKLSAKFSFSSYQKFYFFSRNFSPSRLFKSKSFQTNRKNSFLIEINLFNDLHTRVARSPRKVKRTWRLPKRNWSRDLFQLRNVEILKIFLIRRGIENEICSHSGRTVDSQFLTPATRWKKSWTWKLFTRVERRK